MCELGCVIDTKYTHTHTHTHTQTHYTCLCTVTLSDFLNNLLGKLRSKVVCIIA
ncbi:uncharacterized protein TANIYAMA4_2325 [Streptococcus canis]|nr:uncharacterized protein TANIYAMA4_2325 [Streptococcus canis]